MTISIRAVSARRLEDLALPADRLAQLRAFAARGALPGTAALFSGLRGTDRMLAAETLAGALGRRLYRVDLSRVVGKYIGETEKNLARIFDSAAAGGTLLFFDEADALFGKRSEVKDAHDRYANQEISYLLQRIETHRGPVVLATNQRQTIDPAILRRLRYVIDFPIPRPGGR